MRFYNLFFTRFMTGFHTILSLCGSRYLLSIITAHVKKSEPELETVLLKVKQLQGITGTSRFKTGQ